MKELPPKREKFCLAYLASGNACQAFRESRDTSAMSQRTIEKRASELLADGEVQGRLAELRAEAADKATLSKAWVLEQLMRQVRVTMGDEKVTLTIKPRGKDGQDAAPVTVEVSARDANAANKALELLARHLGLFEADNSQAGEATVAAIGREISDLEAARRIAFLFDRALGQQDNKTGESPNDAPNLH
jgi:phage terminase small subunit